MRLGLLGFRKKLYIELLRSLAMGSWSRGQRVVVDGLKMKALRPETSHLTVTRGPSIAGRMVLMDSYSSVRRLSVVGRCSVWAPIGTLRCFSGFRRYFSFCFGVSGLVQRRSDV